jgi:hypothetical protein
MTKRVIEAKLALQDIRLGMSDLELMIKYRLSSTGLQSLFKKLGQAGLLKHVNAREVQRDLRSGLSHEQIMEKYQLTQSGLADLLKQVNRAGLLHRPMEKDRLPTKIFIRVPEIVKDIRAGMGRLGLMEKYHLSTRGLRYVSMMLVSSGAIAWKEIFENICSKFEELVPGMVRSQRRYSVDLNVPVYDIGRPERVGKLRDVSEGGMGIQGIEAGVGETKTLVIAGDEFGEYSTFVLDVTCRWEAMGPDKEPIAGFEISNISVGSMGEFNLLTELVRLPHQQQDKSS